MYSHVGHDCLLLCYNSPPNYDYDDYIQVAKRKQLVFNRDELNDLPIPYVTEYECNFL